MRFALAVCILLAACAQQQAGRFPPPEPVWQEGPNGWVYGRSPLHLWPAGRHFKEVVHLPDRAFFDAGSARLDKDGRQIALLQAQRLRQLSDHDVTLFCGWSVEEERSLGGEAAQALGAARCVAILAVYKDYGLSTVGFALRPAEPRWAAEDADGALQQSVSLTIVPSGRTKYHAPLPALPELRSPLSHTNGYAYSNDRGIFFPDFVYFKRGETKLSNNTKAVLRVYADSILPYDTYFIVPQCAQAAAEGPDPADVSLARKRCDEVVSYLIEQGMCPDRLFLPRAASAYVTYDPLDRPLAELAVRFDSFDVRRPWAPYADRQFRC